MTRRVIDYQAPPPRPPQPPRRETTPAGMYARLFLRWPVVIGALVTASLLVTTCLGLAWATRPPSSAPATAVLNIIAAPSLTAPAVASNGTPEVTGTVFPEPPPGVVAVGAFVQVTGTGGAGLRLREVPQLDGKVLVLAGEAEVFRVEDGPKEADGYTWWYLVGPYDAERKGWGVVNYLQAVNP